MGRRLKEYNVLANDALLFACYFWNLNNDPLFLRSRILLTIWSIHDRLYTLGKVSGISLAYPKLDSFIILLLSYPRIGKAGERGVKQSISSSKNLLFGKTAKISFLICLFCQYEALRKTDNITSLLSFFLFLIFLYIVGFLFRAWNLWSFIQKKMFRNTRWI